MVLAGIEPVGTEKSRNISALSAIVAGREVSLFGDRTIPPTVMVASPLPPSSPPRKTPVQAQLLAQGDGAGATNETDKECAAALTAAEAARRAAKLGNLADPSAIKNSESPGDILAGIGRFMVVEGKVLSVRQAGATTYLNFGRNWTRDFAVTISRRALPAFESRGGFALKSLENKRIRVRGWVEIALAGRGSKRSMRGRSKCWGN